MSTCMIYNYCVYRSTVSACLCLVVPFCCYVWNGYTDVIWTNKMMMMMMMFDWQFCLLKCRLFLLTTLYFRRIKQFPNAIRHGRIWSVQAVRPNSDHTNLSPKSTSLASWKPGRKPGFSTSSFGFTTCLRLFRVGNLVESRIDLSRDVAIDLAGFRQVRWVFDQLDWWTMETTRPTSLFDTYSNFIYLFNFLYDFT